MNVCSATISTIARHTSPQRNHLFVQAVVNEDAVGTNMMLKAELQRVKIQLAAMHGQTPALDDTLATSLAFDDQPNTAAAHAAQVQSWSLHHTRQCV